MVFELASARVGEAAAEAGAPGRQGRQSAPFPPHLQRRIDAVVHELGALTVYVVSGESP